MIAVPECADGIKCRDGFSIAAAAHGPARRVAESDDTAMFGDVGKAKILCRALN